MMSKFHMEIVANSTTPLRLDLIPIGVDVGQSRIAMVKTAENSHQKTQSQ